METVRYNEERNLIIVTLPVLSTNTDELIRQVNTAKDSALALIEKCKVGGKKPVVVVDLINVPQLKGHVLTFLFYLQIAIGKNGKLYINNRSKSVISFFSAAKIQFDEYSKVL